MREHPLPVYRILDCLTMAELVARLRRNDPSLVQCLVNLRDGACPQILAALQANSCVNEVVIFFALCLGPVWDPNLMANFVKDLVQFLRTAEHVRAVGFHIFPPQTMNFVPLLLGSVVKNPRIKELRFHNDIKLSTEKIVGILQMSSLRRLTLSLHSALDSQVIAAAFGVNTRLEYLALHETEDLSVVEAVLPRLSASSSLSELVLSGGRPGYGYDRGLPKASAPPNSLTFTTTLGHALCAVPLLTQVSLITFVFSSESITALLSGLEANQSISTLRLLRCWFSNDGCGETFASYLRSINVTNPNLKHLAIVGCKIKDCEFSGPFLRLMLLQAPLQVLETSDDISELCQAWVSDAENVTLPGLILNFVARWHWPTLVQSLPGMKSLRELTIRQLESHCNADLILQHMRNHWNLRTVVLRRGDAAILDERQQRLVDAFGMRNGRLPAMLTSPMMPGDDVCDSTDGLSAIQDQEGKVTLALFPSLFQTAQRTKSKSPHILFLGLLSTGDAIGAEPSSRRTKRQAV
jgi:hypothetical protein